MKMLTPGCFLIMAILISLTSATVCPPSCVCTTTPDGLHRAACSNVADLYKFTLQRKHHNINILDLSHNNITKLTHELDRLTEVVTLDLSTNGITEVDKFLHNAQKIVHLNLAHNRIEQISLSRLPKSVSSLDLTHNLLRNVPTDLDNLKHLEHLELNGNPLDCSCENLVARDFLVKKGVLIDHATCESPAKYRKTSWLNLKTKEVCTSKSFNLHITDEIDMSKIGGETNELKQMPLQAARDLDEGETWEKTEHNKADDYDEVLFLEEKRPKLFAMNQIEGSGDERISNDNSEFIHTTEPSIFEGSGEGSGFHGIADTFKESETEETDIFSTTPEVPFAVPQHITPIIDAGNELPDGIRPQPPTVYTGSKNWSEERAISPTTEKPVIQDTTVSEKIQITQAPDAVSATSQESSSPTHKTGTYVCVAIIVVLLVGLIGFAIIKGQMRKRRDRRLLRQQRRDVEKASKEMVDMNKSLLGKPAPSVIPGDKKMNGKYEMVPTHEPAAKKTENGNLSGKSNNEYNHKSPSSRDNNQNLEIKSPEEKQRYKPSNGTVPKLDGNKDNHSLSSDDALVPNFSDSHTNGIEGSDFSQPLVIGDQNTDSDFLSPSRDYVPVYGPDMGRVRIKMSETPKPKTPVLVTRSRSNAGDIIITPNGGNARSSAT